MRLVVPPAVNPHVNHRSVGGLPNQYYPSVPIQMQRQSCPTNRLVALPGVTANVTVVPPFDLFLVVEPVFPGEPDEAAPSHGVGRPEPTEGNTKPPVERVLRWRRTFKTFEVLAQPGGFGDAENVKAFQHLRALIHSQTTVRARSGDPNRTMHFAELTQGWRGRQGCILDDRIDTQGGFFSAVHREGRKVGQRGVFSGGVLWVDACRRLNWWSCKWLGEGDGAGDDLPLSTCGLPSMLYIGLSHFPFLVSRQT